MEPPTGEAGPAATGPSEAPASPGPPLIPTPVPRQRWRLVLACGPEAAGLGAREQAAAWEAALDRTGLPLTRVGRGAARIVFAAPRTVGMPVEAELADIVLTGILPIWHVREALSGALPDGWRLVGLEDAWLGEPPIAAQVSAAEYRVTLAGAPDPRTIVRAAHGLLAETRLPRQRAKGSGLVSYDLRPLLDDVRVADPGPPLVLAIRTRLHPTVGAGRPEEVVAALAAAAGLELVVTSTVRECVILGEVD